MILRSVIRDLAGVSILERRTTLMSRKDSMYSLIELLILDSMALLAAQLDFIASGRAVATLPFQE